eukprot:2434143-Amphidinium_carterae.1
MDRGRSSRSERAGSKRCSLAGELRYSTLSPAGAAPGGILPIVEVAGLQQRLSPALLARSAHGSPLLAHESTLAAEATASSCCGPGAFATSCWAGAAAGSLAGGTVCSAACVGGSSCLTESGGISGRGFFAAGGKAALLEVAPLATSE